MVKTAQIPQADKSEQLFSWGAAVLGKGRGSFLQTLFKLIDNGLPGNGCQGFQLQRVELNNYQKQNNRAKNLPTKLIVKITNDNKLKQQYYSICEQEFKNVHHLSEYNITPDDRFITFVVLYDGKCVGGLSVAVKRHGSSRLLPEESDDFRFADCVPELGQSNMSYGLISRFALLPEFRGGKITRTIFSVLYEYVRALDLDLVLAIGPLANARLYKQIYSAMGFENGKIHFDIDVPRMPGFQGAEYLVSARIGGSPAKEVNAEKAMCDE